jgi:hypothetical protein
MRRTLADATCRSGGGIHAPLDIAHTYSACQPVLDADTRLLSLRINDEDYAEVTDVERIMA